MAAKGYDDGYRQAVDNSKEWFKKHYREYVLGGDDMLEVYENAMEE